jgi:hypothetical protein
LKSLRLALSTQPAMWYKQFREQGGVNGVVNVLSDKVRL